MTVEHYSGPIGIWVYYEASSAEVVTTLLRRIFIYFYFFCRTVLRAMDRKEWMTNLQMMYKNIHDT